MLLILPRQLSDPHFAFVDSQVDFRPFDKPRLRHPVRQLLRMRWILRQIRDFRPDVIHLQSGHLWFNMALPLLKRYALVVTVHDPRHHLGDRGQQNTPQRVMDFGYRKADRIIVHGQDLKHAIAQVVTIPRDKIHVIPHIAIGDRPEEERADEERNLILFFGRIWRYKGLDYLIRAQPRITDAIPDAKILIAGTGEDFSTYERMMVDSSKFVVENRWISHDERALMFQRASVVVLPYVEATQSGVVPVAYTYSKPVVATRTGGLPDIVDHGQTGLLVPPRDDEALADAIIALLRDDKLRRRMGIAGRQKLDAECAPEVVARQTADVYRRAIEDARNTSGHGRGKYVPAPPITRGVRKDV